METLTLFLTIIAVLLVLWPLVGYSLAAVYVARLPRWRRDDVTVSATPLLGGLLGAAWLLARWLT